MNYAIVFRLLSYILLCESALLMLPAATSAIYGEWSVLGAFLITAALCVVFGLLLRLAKPTSKVFYMREGFATTATIPPTMKTKPPRLNPPAKCFICGRALPPPH